MFVDCPFIGIVSDDGLTSVLADPSSHNNSSEVKRAISPANSMSSQCGASIDGEGDDEESETDSEHESMGAGAESDNESSPSSIFGKY